MLALLAEGLSDREIAARLFISAHTVHRHVSNILTKLSLRNRAAAAAYAACHGIGSHAGLAPSWPAWDDLTRADPAPRPS